MSGHRPLSLEQESVTEYVLDVKVVILFGVLMGGIRYTMFCPLAPSGWAYSFKPPCLLGGSFVAGGMSFPNLSRH